MHGKRREAFCYGRARFSSFIESVLSYCLFQVYLWHFGKLHETRFGGGSRPGYVRISEA
jgi:hypothetical protein